MKSIKGTKTEKNLLAAFAGESQARNRYTFAAKVAENEGYEQIANIFIETADNERMHAKRFYRFLEGGDVEITASYPAGVSGNTTAQLEAGAAGEHLEWTKLYVESAKVADEEGFPEVATQFRMIAKVEEKHEARYRKLIENIKGSKVFKKDTKVRWKCLKCGHIHEGPEAPKTCPACDHPQAYFEMFVETY
ncbi:MAG: rubrerythrin [Omnitrophica bacterium RIFCSPLOWO2_12_FULL_44_17]|uniref:Rubrerythrin n=1 Tax=Candidatus Danuiimicrobium aquiferis TaxID=1801832 RepID=A0A1G1KZK1_9BACT|nr:MAG: rubrerythrin [Omnitrophica bacterium RIFCSPHIGHO2_02_FULL_45_28]OGW89119.1 MAG: rubrerythrin [Omnitrophica bacterium RIFCSPHIGHO2_12_FULL_44_12]OGW98292.1 MAG: rubrerythrin [Omnitrophica bacterium RIFCSPLOWO2_12_FULL_44_17]OGX02886.1 MAG: rubrerythrin [Omnitrophica bacterium RIFCSPLOWO2_02_FULL_44_11]